MDSSPAPDPAVPDWGNLKLPDAWPDRLRLPSPLGLWRLLRAMLGRRRPLQLPDDLPGRSLLPKYLLQERPGGLLAICEPSARQWSLRPWRLSCLSPSLLYFHWLARRAHDPFAEGWHRYDVARDLEAAGFELIEDVDAMPVRHLLARRRALPAAA